MPILARAPRSLALELTPPEVAAACAHLPGRVFFDTALEGGEGGQLSIVAAAPREILRGRRAQDWEALREAVAARAGGPDCDDGLPAGFAAGFVEYDGTFCFGLYDDALIYRHGSQTWSGGRELAAQWQNSPAAQCRRPDFGRGRSQGRYSIGAAGGGECRSRCC